MKTNGASFREWNSKGFAVMVGGDGDGGAMMIYVNIFFFFGVMAV